MNKTVKPISFAQHFNIDEDALKKLGVFNPILNLDTKFFVDPLLLKDSQNPIIKKGFKTYNEFFRKTLILLKISKEKGDKAWKEAKKRLYFPEYKSTCIGYGSDSINGSGSGKELNEKILKSAKEIIDCAKNDPEIFLLLPLLEEGIGADIISDMTQNIIDDEICKYTINIMEKLGLKGTHKYQSKECEYILLWNPYYNCHIKLLPRDILDDLPMADMFDQWLVNVSEVNLKLRERINIHLGNEWFKENKRYKKETLLNFIKKDTDFFFAVLETLKDSVFEHYDSISDPKGLRRWLEDSKKFINTKDFNKIHSVEARQESLFEAVEEIIMHFRELIENKDLWKIFWTKHGSKMTHVNELYSRMLFYFVSDVWLFASDSNISVECISNAEMVFSLSQKIKMTVWVKHSSNAKGIEKAYSNNVHIQNSNKENTNIVIIMQFTEDKTKRLDSIIKKSHNKCTIREIQVYQNNNIQNTADIDMQQNWYDLDSSDTRYYKEKSKGGKDSYKCYKPLRDKVIELCKDVLAKEKYCSAMQLCNHIAEMIERNHFDLLKDFQPYQIHAENGNDWKTTGTFYRWCNDVYKDHREITLIDQ